MVKKTSNEYYINIVERSSGLKPEKIEFDNSVGTSRYILHSIINRYKSHPISLRSNRRKVPNLAL